MPLVENDDQWHFDQQLLRYHSGLNLVITEQEQLDGFLRREWLKLTDDPIVIHRIKVDLEEAFDWDDQRRNALLHCLCGWRNHPTVKYTTGSRTDYYFECRGDSIAAELDHNWQLLDSRGLVGTVTRSCLAVTRNGHSPQGRVAFMVKARISRSWRHRHAICRYLLRRRSR